MSEGKLIIISGPSGCGKGTVINKLLSSHKELCLSVSMTTRKPRPGEKDGVHYHFTDSENFKFLIESKGLLEYTHYGENYYGTPVKPIEDAVKNGKSVILDIEVEGAHNVRSLGLDNVVSIFLVPPSFTELEARLRGRGTETEEQIKMRLERAEQEMSHKDNYDYVVTNGDLDVAVKEIENIIYNK